MSFKNIFTVTFLNFLVGLWVAMQIIFGAKVVVFMAFRL